MSGSELGLRPQAPGPTPALPLTSCAPWEVPPLTSAKRLETETEV